METTLTFESTSELFGLSWSTRQDQPFRAAVSTFEENFENKVQIIDRSDPENTSKDPTSLTLISEFDHSYPATKVQWIPDFTATRPELIATTGDFLRIWDASNASASNPPKLACLLNNYTSSEFCAPLTSFDWNEADPRLLGTASIDTTCTIWDVETEQATTQLIAHDKEVFDFAFARGTNVFASVGADGSVRLFDLRSLEHSTIIYETQDLTPLLRLRWNKQDPNYIATVVMGSNTVLVLDIRVPSLPVAELAHRGPAAAPVAPVNAVSWAAHSSCHVCTAGDDSNLFIWDISAVPKPIEEPVLAFDAGVSINNLEWSSSNPDWIGIVSEKKFQCLRV